jgi:hypothetical protein
MRHDNPELTDANGNRVLPRTLLQTETVSSPVTAVTLVLPASPWTRFTIEVDDWGGITNQEHGRIRCMINGDVRFGASDYSYAVAAHPATSGVATSQADASTFIAVTRTATTEFGDQPDESFSFSFHVQPGVDSVNLPKLWWEGTGVADAGTLAGIRGHGMYRGKSALQYGRIEQIEFTMSMDSIREGTFRLYGTE